MICTMLNHLDYDGLLSISFLSNVLIQENTVTYFTLASELTFSDLKISRRNIKHFPEISHKEMFLITLVETITDVFSKHI